jgi:hypothetical protein
MTMRTTMPIASRRAFVGLGAVANCLKLEHKSVQSLQEGGAGRRFRVYAPSQSRREISRSFSGPRVRTWQALKGRTTSLQHST